MRNTGTFFQVLENIQKHTCCIVFNEVFGESDTVL